MAALDHPFVIKRLQDEKDAADRVLVLARYMAGDEEPDSLTVLVAAVVALTLSSGSN